ncbi:MAG: IPExxxVDY family protein [Bacteroidales bacterium]|nr:IPExxxVDY family protein [Bacteroidales bacterium]
MAILKSKLDFEYYSMIGVSCHLKDYRLTYYLNKTLGIDLKKSKEFSITKEKEKKNIHFSFFIFNDKKKEISYYLISNHNPESKLIPSQKQIDYLLITKDLINQENVMEIINKIKTISYVLTAYKIELSKIRSINNLLSDLEIHVSNISPKTNLRNRKSE